MNKLTISLLALSALLLSGLVQAEGSVARAIVTTGVADREPVNDLERVLAGNEKVIFFTELREMQGQTVKHRWSRAGEQVAEVEFHVGGPRWRVWSSKNLLPEWAGEWRVEVLDSEGNVLSEKNFEIAAANGAASSAADEDVAGEDVAGEEVSGEGATDSGAATTEGEPATE
jgi:hypothetical protein